MHVETCVTLTLFPTFPSTQTIKVIRLIFSLSCHEKLDYEHAFQPYTSSLRSFSWGGGTKCPPRLYLDSDPLAFKGLLIIEKIILSIPVLIGTPGRSFPD